MKHTFRKTSLVLSLALASYLAGAQVKVNSIGSVGIGLGATNPSYKLEVNGDISVTAGNVYRIDGNKILWYNGTNSSNIFVGTGAGTSTSTGNHNCFVGNMSGHDITTGSFNTYVGGYAGAANLTSLGSTAIGNHALASATGGFNTAIGLNAGTSITSGTLNTFLGTSTDASAGNLQNATAIGNAAIVNASNKVRIGNASVTVVEGPVAYTVSDGRFKFNVKEEVAGLDFINKLRPVNYQMDTKKFNDHVRKGMPQEKGDGLCKADNTGLDFSASTSIIHSGFIAQEVEQAAKSCGYTTDIVGVPANENDNYSLAYGAFVVPLVKAVQELSTKVNQLERELKNTKDNATGADIEGKALSIHALELANNTVLFQNFPNPFGDGTTIKYFIPDNVENAQVVFFDEFGNKLNEYKVSDKGMGQLNISSTNLSTGTYSYSLIVNDKVVDTKKMMKVK